MAFSLVLFCDYQTTSLGIFKNGTLVATNSAASMQASAQLILMIDALLKSTDLAPENLTYIVVNKGPGPSTTVRVGIAYANSIAYALQKPIIGVNSLEALAREHNNTAGTTTVALLNAFNHDVFFGIYADGSYQEGCKEEIAFLQELTVRFAGKTIRFVGNSVAPLQEKIIEIFGDCAKIPSPLPQHATLEFIGMIAHQKWQQQIDIEDEITPLYLKTLHYKKSTAL